MKKDWGFVEKILRGKKTIESRWYAARRAPWNTIQDGEITYFKNSGEPVLAKAEVKKVLQFSNLSPSAVKSILEKYGGRIGIEKQDAPKFYKMLARKKYCILIFLKNPQKIKPFKINKKGFGAMASWITVKNVSSIMIRVV